MNKSELIQAIADEAELSKHDAEEFINAFISVVTQELKDGNNVTLVGFGVFHVSERAERQGRNPQTGETLTIPATKKPRFRPGNPLKEAVK